MVSFLIHRDEVERTAVLEKKRYEEDNLQTRFSILWDNVPPTTTNNKDNTKLLILLRDPNLIEYYQDNSNSAESLIYWFAWNVNKDDFSIPEKSKSELTSVESFTQLYPYQLFLPDSPQLTNNIDNSIVNLKLDVIPITDEINDKLTKLYQNPRMKESMFFHHKQFYREMSKILQQNTIQEYIWGLGTDNTSWMRQDNENSGWIQYGNEIFLEISAGETAPREVTYL